MMNDSPGVRVVGQRGLWFEEAEKRRSASRPGQGVVTFEHVARNQPQDEDNPVADGQLAGGQEAR